MDDNFDIQQFGKSLSNILSILSESNYTSIDPITTELKADSIDSALSILETRLRYFKSYNFHPISASITKILAFAYRIVYFIWLSKYFTIISALFIYRASRYFYKKFAAMPTR